ncbi:hypothetical protein M885DRAFT_618779 [Pelagophyceae sp. CCMP2097]|nr:hypothetical protein M885DRAFT_618779 [Pelagophyceae sp. CCMP2097]
MVRCCSSSPGRWSCRRRKALWRATRASSLRSSAAAPTPACERAHCSCSAAPTSEGARAASQPPLFCDTQSSRGPRASWRRGCSPASPSSAQRPKRTSPGCSCSASGTRHRATRRPLAKAARRSGSPAVPLFDGRALYGPLRALFSSWTLDGPIGPLERRLATAAGTLSWQARAALACGGCLRLRWSHCHRGRARCRRLDGLPRPPRGSPRGRLRVRVVLHRRLVAAEPARTPGLPQVTMTIKVGERRSRDGLPTDVGIDGALLPLTHGVWPWPRRTTRRAKPADNPTDLLRPGARYSPTLRVRSLPVLKGIRSTASTNSVCKNGFTRGRRYEPGFVYTKIVRKNASK